MKKHMFNAGLILLGFIFILSGCKKDDDSDPQTNSKSNTEYLTAGYWKITSMSIDPGVSFGGTVITDFYSQMPACSKDDLIRFNADGSITDDEGATKCDTNDPQTTNEGTWVMSSDNQSVTIDYPDEDPITITFIELGDATMKGSYTQIQDFGSGPLTYTFTVTMMRQ